MRRALVTSFVCAATPAMAAESARSVSSPLGGNGHNVSFDGRLYVVTRGGPSGVGWYATVFRPELVGRDVTGFPEVSNAFSDFTLIQPDTNAENALAICEPDPTRAPFLCDDMGNEGGLLGCYDLVVFDSDALNPGQDRLRRRELRVWVQDPGSPQATVLKHEWLGTMTHLPTRLMGIEPTVTADGRLMIYQGHPDNDGKIDVLMYSVNNDPCALDGWSAPRPISSMHADPAAIGQWRLAERPLRATDGAVFGSGEIVRGAYPWLFPEGDALIFTAANMPCRATEDPPGCGPRRNALSVVGYPTNWGISHIDGEVNPSTADTVRLFFSSPGRDRFPQVPVTPGVDVWPFFGSNTSNYTEIILDDGLDGQYAGIWHMNEVVDKSGEMNKRKTPDSSGYFNTGDLILGAVFPEANNGRNGSSKAVELNGSNGRVRVPHNASLNPVNAITVELSVFPANSPDCDGNNNWRLLLGKGNIGTGAYSLVFEESGQFQARVKVGGQQYALWSGASIPAGQWSHVAFTYHAATGKMAFFIDGVETASVLHPPGPLDGSSDPLDIGGAGITPACPDGDGSFEGLIDEVRISRVVRFGTSTSEPDAGMPDDTGVSVDALPVDEGFEDASEPDSGVEDARADPTDLGSATLDASVPVDAAIPVFEDASSGVDAAQVHPDAASAQDASISPVPDPDKSCNCQHTPPRSSPWVGLGALLLAGIFRRRRA